MSAIILDGLESPFLVTDGLGPPAIPSFLGTWAGIGTTLVVAADGTITGNPVFAVRRGSAYGIQVLGTPFIEGGIALATLTLALSTPATITAVPAPDGSSSAGYGVIFVLPGSATSGAALGYYPYTITLVAGTGDQDEIVASRLLVLPA